ncbi:MAG TPA: hypothetical protein VFI06_12450, partial [Chitinophagaceae bacterium]|nr:hypothetical protein [Chitinophagaceae bacterium]
MPRAHKRKIIAAFFLVIFGGQLFYPLSAHALTSGPAQPEMTKFAPAGASDLVDLFSGDLKYNIPLMDVGGYPINLAYNSGTGMEDEATWVGTGWTLNPGAVNRTMRGLPDDFDGGKGTNADLIKKEYSQKDFKKVGARLTVKGSLIGKELGLSGGVSVDVYKDNYWGIGTAVGVDAGLSLSQLGGSPLTVGLDLGVNSDTRNGVDVSPRLSVEALINATKDVNLSGGLSGGFTYNTRAGLKEVSLGTSFSASVQANDIGKFGFTLDNSAVKYFGQSFTPSLNNSRANTGFTFSFDVGTQGKIAGFGAGGTGYVYKEKIVDKVISAPAFGYMNYLRGRKNDNALLDFNREKDGVFIESTPALAIPVPTNDFFLATGQTGSQQFRPYYGGNYMVNDRKFVGTTNNTTNGITINVGDIVKIGGSFFKLTGTDESKKWTDFNFYNTQQEAAFTQTGTLTPLTQPVYFKQVGEMTQVDKTYLDTKVGGETEMIRTNPTSASYTGRNNSTRATTLLEKVNRERKITPFSYLNARDASKYGLNKLIDATTCRVSDYRKPHHISEITVTDEGGKRMIYGIPVYNTEQQDVSFSINVPANQSTADAEKGKRNGLIQYNSTQASMANKDGRLNIFSKETVPAYATSYLLTAVVSPDYVDKTGNGISDDDLGTAVKLNYERLKVNNANVVYKWRAPYQQDMANYNEGFNSDKKDDKASYSYGEKEIWYLKSIESKTMIAVFYTSNREDGLGVNGPSGVQNTTVKLKKIDQIKLYTKADYYKHPGTAIPVKVVNLEYDYSLYKNVANNSGIPVYKNGTVITSQQDITDPAKNVNINKGKLTLKRVYFTFGDNTRGVSNPYDFEYDLRMINDGTTSVPAHSTSVDIFQKEATDAYTERQTDRWGTYKQSWYNHLYETGSQTYDQTYKITTSEFPYSLQKNYVPKLPSHSVTAADWEGLVDRMASKWQLNKITTPTGGVITVEYESDDYAFVQDRKAMQMCFVKGITTDGTISGLKGSNTLVVELPRKITGGTQVEKDAKFRDLYLRQPDGRLLAKMFYKISVDIDNKGHYEYINGYAEIDGEISTVSSTGELAFLRLKPIYGINPVTKAAWQ